MYCFIALHYEAPRQDGRRLPTTARKPKSIQSAKMCKSTKLSCWRIHDIVLLQQVPSLTCRFLDLVLKCEKSLQER